MHRNGTMDAWPSLLFFLAYIVLTLSMARYGHVVLGKEIASVVAAGLVAPDEADLLTYIAALYNAREEVRKQASQILATLLGQLSEESLACIGDPYWRLLCHVPGDGSVRDDVLDRDDDLNLAVIMAVMKLERTESLLYIERLMTFIDRKPHSDHYVRTLTECYSLLMWIQVGHNQPSLLLRPSEAPLSPDTLLRPSSAEAIAPEVLLRPVSGMQPSEIDSGEQLLRASTRNDPGSAR